MKSPVLILFIIFNLLSINMASAASAHDEETKESHLVQIQDVAQDTELASSTDESSCDHLCHISAHMMGFISHMTSLSMVVTSIIVTDRDETFYSLTQDPPSQPPRS